MAEVIRMPRLSDTMEEGNIISWQKKVGDTVSPGDILAEVETDKATMDLESFQSGTLLYIAVDSGPIPVDGILAIIGEKGESFDELLAEAESVSNHGTEIKKEATSEENIIKPELSSDKISLANMQGSPESPAQDGRIKASPLAKRLAQEKGISIEMVDGSGENGRIVKKDIENYIPAGSKTANTKDSTTEQKPSLPSVSYGDKPVSQMRKIVAKRLGESKFTAPHFYLTCKVDMTNSFEARKKMNEMAAPDKISFNDLIVKTCAFALRKHPFVNSSWYGDKITVHEDINIGVAVAVEDGLLVPVIRHADQKSLLMINEEVKELAELAKNRKLAPEQMQGNTFTISNLGMFGIEEFTAIINPPDACILAVGSILDKPIVKNGTVVPGKIMKLTLSCDHRVVDGATGAKFLQTVTQYLEEPVRLLL